MRQRDRAPSLVVEDEWEPRHLNRSNIDKTKRLLEGQGGVFEEKYQNPFVAFEKAYFFLSTNTLARVLGGAKDKLEDDELLNRAAMNTRMQQFKFVVSYKNGTKKPFDAPEIALALRYLYDVYQPKEEEMHKPLCTQIEYPDFPIPQNPNVRSDPSLNIRAPDVASPNIPNAPLGEDIPLQARQDRKRTADQRIKELEDQLREKDEALKKSREEKAEMKRAIKLGLRFIRDEQDWTGKPPTTISFEKTKEVVKAAGINLSQSTEEKLSSVASAKKQRLEEEPEREDA